MNVFISYSDADRELAEDLKEALTDHGLDVWLVYHEVMPGDNWLHKVGNALENADAIVALISKHSMHDRDVGREISYAIPGDKFKNKLIPIYLDPPDQIEYEELPWVLKNINHLQLSEYPDRKAAFDDVADRLLGEENLA
jgi:hypothetical protein